MSQDYCVLLPLAVHLETECMEKGASPEDPWLFSLQTNNPSNAKRKAYTIIDVELPYPDAKVAAAHASMF